MRRGRAPAAVQRRDRDGRCVREMDVTVVCASGRKVAVGVRSDACVTDLMDAFEQLMHGGPPALEVGMCVEAHSLQGWDLAWYNGAKGMLERNVGNWWCVRFDYFVGHGVCGRGSDFRTMNFQPRRLRIVH